MSEDDFQTLWLVLQILPDCIHITVFELQSSVAPFNKVFVLQNTVQCMAYAKKGKVIFGKGLFTVKIS